MEPGGSGPGAVGRAGLGWVAALWLLSRGLLLAVALLVMVRERRSAHDVISAWDVAHFEAIATNGYANPVDRAFFPGLPLLLRAAGWLGLPLGLAGVLVAAVASALAAVALLRLGQRLAGSAAGPSRAGATTVGVVAAGLWLFAPTTVFTAVGYTEAPFCAAAFWAWERAVGKRWGQAALLAGLACTFRVSGLFLVGGLGLLALTQRGVAPARRLLNATLAAAAALVLVAHAAYLHHLTGSWNAWFEAQQSGWNRGFTNPLDALRHTLDATNPTMWPGRPSVGRVFAAEVGSMALGCLLSLVLLARRRWAEAGWVAVQVFAFATSWWFMSVNRAVLLWFPLWLLLGEAALVGWPPAPTSGTARSWLARALVVAATLASVALMLVWAWLYFTGAWAS